MILNCFKANLKAFDCSLNMFLPQDLTFTCGNFYSTSGNDALFVFLKVKLLDEHIFGRILQERE